MKYQYYMIEFQGTRTMKPPFKLGRYDNYWAIFKVVKDQCDDQVMPCLIAFLNIFFKELEIKKSYVFEYYSLAMQAEIMDHFYAPKAYLFDPRHFTEILY